MEKVANTPLMVGSDGERLPILAKLRKSNLPKKRKGHFQAVYSIRNFCGFRAKNGAGYKHTANEA